MDRKQLQDPTDGGSRSSLYRYRIRQVEFDEARFELRVGSLVVELERKPLQVFGELLRHANEVVTRQQLIDAVWDGRPMVDQALANAIVKLRKAVDDQRGEWLVTVPRRGYKCVGSVERIAVGRRIRSHFTLRAGEHVPARNDFRLESQLQGTAGNEVWLAKDVNGAQRRVFKFSRDGEQLVALKREATVFRLLNESLGERSDFVKVLSWNFETQPFYLECEYGGVDLAAWANADGQLTASSITQRLVLFLQIAAAVQAAHSVGVLHKDLKPANVLIAPSGDGWQVRVADFGNARLLEPERLQELGITRMGLSTTGVNSGSASSGTPLYMAPEIMDGETPTIRSDVYSLGLLLYQMVIGNLRRPLAPGWEDDVVDPLLREDIAAATAGDPERRLSSVGELATRLQTLEARATERRQAAAAAERATLAERALERARARRPWLFAAVASLTIGLGVSLWLYSGESTARRDLERQDSLNQAIIQFLNEVLRTADPGIPGGAAKVTIEDALAVARAKLERRFDTDPVTKGSLYGTLGETYFGLGRYELALPLQQEAIRLLAAALGPEDTATLTVQYQTVRTLDMLTRHKEASQLLERTDRAARVLLPRDSRLALLAHWTAGGSAKMQMQPDRAEREFTAAESARARAAPNDETWLFRLRADLAWCNVRLQRNEDAVRILEDLLQTKYTPERVGVTDWTRAHLQYVLALANLARTVEAERAARDVIRETERMFGPDHYLVGLGWSHLATVFKSDARWSLAVDAASHAYRIFRRAVGEQNRSTLNALGDVAVFNYLGGQARESLDQLAAVHGELSRAVGADSPFTQYVGFYWASALLDIGNAEAASRLVAALDPLALTAVDSGIAWAPRIQGLQGRILLATNRKEEGRALLKSAIEALSMQNVQSWVLAPLQRAQQSQ